jgi:ribonuclease BN (tRNA processing enzyme)
VKLTVIGCAGTISGPDSDSSCYLVEHDGFRLVIDLGHGALGALQRFVDIADIDAIALSHLHADHWIDLTALYVALRYGPYNVTGRLPVFGPTDTADRLADAYGVGRSPGMHSAFDFQDLSMTTAIGPFRVRTARMAHPIEAYGIRLDAGGHSLVYSGDTGPCNELVELATGAELLLAEASCVDGDEQVPDLHMTGKQAGKAATHAGVSHLVVTHVPPWNSREVALREAKSTFAGVTTLAAPGWSIDLAR